MTLSEELREQMRNVLVEGCSTCHRPLMTTRELARTVGVTPSSLSRWLTGKSAPSAALLDAADMYLKSLEMKGPWTSGISSPSSVE